MNAHTRRNCVELKSLALLPMLLVIFLASSMSGATGSSNQTNPSDSSQNLEHVNWLSGAVVFDAGRAPVGQIKQVVLTPSLNQVAFVVMPLDKDGKREIAIPLPALHRNEVGQLAIDVNRANLQHAPMFNRTKWQEMMSDAWAKKNEAYYLDHSLDMSEQAKRFPLPATVGNQESEPIVSAATSYRDPTKLVGLEVHTRTAENVGTLEDLIVDMQEGRLIYGILSMGAMHADDKLAVVPWSSLQVRPRQGIISVDAEASAVESVAFAAVDFPNLTDRNYATKIFRAFAREPYWQVYGYARVEADPKVSWMSGSEFNRRFDPGLVRTAHCVVESVGTFVPDTGAVDGLRVRARSQTGSLITILVGPRSYTARLGMELHHGDSIIVTGSDARFNGRLAMFPTQIEKGATTYRFRDANGEPLWEDKDIE